MRVELLDALPARAPSRTLRVHVVRERLDARLARPASSSGRRAPRPGGGQSTTDEQRQLRPVGCARRTLRSFHGVTTGPARCSAPAATRRARGRLAVVDLRRRRAPAPATRAPTSISSIAAACASFDELERRARRRRGSRRAPSSVASHGSQLLAGRARRGRTRAPARSRRRSGRGGAPYGPILPDDGSPCAPDGAARRPSGATTASNSPGGHGVEDVARPLRAPARGGRGRARRRRPRSLRAGAASRGSRRSRARAPAAAARRAPRGSAASRSRRARAAASRLAERGDAPRRRAQPRRA